MSEGHISQQITASRSSQEKKNNSYKVFHNSKKRSLGKYLKEKPQMAGKEQNRIPE